MRFTITTLFNFIICNIVLVRGDTKEVAEFPEGVVSRILYGTPANIKEFPYFASLDDFCGAAIISHKWLVTAAHCVEKSKPQKAYIGGENVANSIVVNIEYRIKHPYFDVPVDTFNNDIALLRLSQPLTFNDKIKPIKLPEKDIFSTAYKFVGKGFDEAGSSSFSIMHIDLVRLTPEECLIRLDCDDQDFVRPFLENTMICVTRKEHLPGVCAGDSGGPMVVNDTLIGITSFVLNKLPNIKDNCLNAPVTFNTKVFAYIPWIKSVVGSELII